MKKPAYRLKKPSHFSLNPKKLYLAFETSNGFRLKIDENNWIGLPKFVVKKSKMFEVYNPQKHKAAKLKTK